jgi:hypothetical protein
LGLDSEPAVATIRFRDAEGVKESSRRLSAATPPETFPKNQFHPGGVTAALKTRQAQCAWMRHTLASYFVHRVKPVDNSMKSLSLFSPSPRLRVSA